jgi:hypothetical protein
VNTYPERSIGGVPLLYGFTTLNPMEVAVYCRFCLVWHHHKLIGPPTVVSYFEGRCYARPEWHDRGYWVEPTSTLWRRVRRQVSYASPAQARALAAGRVSGTVRQKQLLPEPRPQVRPSRPPAAPRKTRRDPYGPQWPTAYPQPPERPGEG